ncbi:MAG: aldolase/citrate lyase family protein [Dehalococcoidia bacterium]|nr:aldolase/citrate lyase family protein [Dehalococcoidia bacterium]
MKKNEIKQIWQKNEIAVGGWLTVNSSFSAEVMANCGFDWLCIDMQHGLIDFSDVIPMIQAISTTDCVPLVRVPWNEPYQIMQVLDAGAYGVIVPLINNKEDAEKAVTACKYPPNGKRSSGAARAAFSWGQNYKDFANDEVLCIVMIETEEALENLDEILSTPGVDAAYIGPSDLAYAIGVEPTGDNISEKHHNAIMKIFEACKRNNVIPGIHTHSLEFSKKYKDIGFKMIMLGAETRFMKNASIEVHELKDK